MRSRLDDAFPSTPVEDAVEHVQEATKINGGDLRSELERLPSQIAHYGVQYARAYKAQIATKAALVEIEQSMYLSARESAESLGEKVTEATLAAKVGRLSVVREAKAAAIEAEYEREAMRAVCDSLRAKREALNALVQLARAEMSGPGSTTWRGTDADLNPDNPDL
jgi:hypothetical protein